MNGNPDSDSYHYRHSYLIYRYITNVPVDLILAFLLPLAKWGWMGWQLFSIYLLSKYYFSPPKNSSGISIIKKSLTG